MIKRIIIVIISIIVVVLGRGFFYYSGFYTPPPAEIPNYEKFIIPLAPTSEFSDESSESMSEEEKAVLIDLAHENNFAQEELNVLMLRIISRGLDIRFLKAEDELEKELLGREAEEKEIEEEEKPPEEKVEEDTGHEEEPSGQEDEAESQQGEEQLEEEGGQVKLKGGDEEIQGKKILPEAFIIVSPQKEFSEEEIKIVKEFVDGGGKLLLIDDPTRMGKINSISIEFGLIFEPDYLYNLKENEINYRNIFISEFADNEITKDLRKIVLYVAGSISSPDGGIAFVDRNTSSSLIESRRELSPIALNEESKVLAIHDLTFLTEPYNGAFDNNQLIANIADWLSIPVGEEKGEEGK